MKEEKKEFEPIPAFNDHGSMCKGHENFMLDCTYTKKEDRELIKKCVGNYISNAR